jgi:hypothetical protein
VTRRKGAGAVASGGRAVHHHGRRLPDALAQAFGREALLERKQPRAPVAASRDRDLRVHVVEGVSGSRSYVNTTRWSKRSSST